ncbi:lysophospholipid acyltransferase family protein [Specibacter cremeus]|uniref:lysophospholipid acyltransferase family protein n=1 Tax=Specibacter cremeus TaxID=1629051 RepID=UPI001F0B937E|nr:lysophospholipid acyltransferase family protein [Specibacter cremeus]
MAWTARPLINLLTAKKWEGLHNLPTGRGFIAAPNHCTEIDPVIVGHMLYNQNVMPHFLAKEGLFRVPGLGALLRGSRQIPVERSGAGAGRSLEVARGVLDDGDAVIIYPEGTLTRDPDLWPMKGRTGAARLALNTGALVVPIAHWGAQEVFPRYAKRLHVFPRKTTRVLVGKPVDLDRFMDGPDDKATLEAMTEVIMDAITELLEQLRGEKAPAQRWDPTAHHQTLHGRFMERGEEPTDGGGTPETGDGQ